MIDIRSKSGSLVLSVVPNDGSKRVYTLMKEDYILLKFSLDSAIGFQLANYVDCQYGTFEVCTKQKPIYNINTGGYDYELRMDAHYWKWKNKILKYTPDKAGQEASWSITDTLEAHAKIIIGNISALGYTYKGRPYTYSIDSTVEVKRQLVTYENTSILDACFEVAKKWECDCWITEHVIHFGRCEFGDQVDFEEGVNVEGMNFTESKNEYATRIYAFGSTRNIPSDYRPVNGTIVVNGVVQRRLMLPSGVPYIDAYSGMSTEEAIEKVVIFDHIYPRRTGTMSGVTTHEYTDEIKDGEETTYENWNAYRFKDEDIIFSKDYVLKNKELTIRFESGLLNGMEFAVTFNPYDEEGGETPQPEKNPDGTWNPLAQVWEIVRNSKYGRPLPDDTLKPKDGDTYVLSGWDASKITDLGLVSKAETELKEYAEKYIKKTKIDPNTYTCPMMFDDESTFLDIGTRVKLINDGYFENGFRESRIIGLEYDFNVPYDHPIYTVGETTSYSKVGELEEKLDSITFEGNDYEAIQTSSDVYLIRSYDNTPESDSNAYSSKRSQIEFISKTRPDSTPHRVTFYDGSDYGEYQAGILGSGGRIDGAGNGELESLRLRGFLEVPELRFNRIDVVSGELWNSIAFGTVMDVEEDGENPLWGRLTLHLEEEEYGGLREGDICRGIFHGLGGQTSGEGGTDDCGFDTVMGFGTVYFFVRGVSGAHYETVLYELKEGSGHPCAAMKFAVYGSFSNPSRRASAYHTRTYTRYLSGVDTWRIQNRNITAQFGLLDGLYYGGQPLTGYGSFQKNAYFTGVSMQLNPDTAKEFGESYGGYGVNLSSYEGVVHIPYNATEVEDGNLTEPILVSATLDGGAEVLTGADTDARDGYIVGSERYKLYTQINVHRGDLKLNYLAGSVPSARRYTVEMEATGLEASIDGGTVYVTRVTNVNGGKLVMRINCSGDAVITKEYNVKVIRDGASAISADLTNETQAVPCKAGGAVDTGGKDALSYRSEVFGFFGTEAMSPVRCSVESITDGNGDDATTGISTTVSSIGKNFVLTVTLGKNFVFNDSGSVRVNLSPTFSYLGTEYRVDGVSMNFYAVRPGEDGSTPTVYGLEMSSSHIKLDRSGAYYPESLTVSQYAVSKGGYKPTTDGVFAYSSDGGAYAFVLGNPDFSLNVTDLHPAKDIRLLLLPANNLGVYDDAYVDNVLPYDSETVMVVRDGENGTDGAPGRPGNPGEAGKDGVGVERIVTEFGTSASPALAPEDGGWSEDVPQWENGKYIWTRTRIVYTDGRQVVTDAVCISGGRGIDSTSEEYVQTDSNMEIPGDELAWGAVYPPAEKGKYVWMRLCITYTDGTVERTRPVCVTGIQGEPGKDGADGENGKNYSLIAPVTTFRRNSLGSVSVTSIPVTALCNGTTWNGGRIYLFGTNDGVAYTYLDVVIDSGTMRVPYSPDYNTLVAALYHSGTAQPISPVNSGALAALSITTVSDGKDGAPGEDGVNLTENTLLRNCGEWDETRTYVFNRDFRDSVWVAWGGGSRVFAMKHFGTSSTGENPLENSDVWDEANREIFTAIDTALIDGANIAGFMYKNQRMVSQAVDKNGNPNIELDGVYGYIKANDLNVCTEAVRGADGVWRYKGGRVTTHSVHATGYLNGNLTNLENDATYENGTPPGACHTITEWRKRTDETDSDKTEEWSVQLGEKVWDDDREVSESGARYALKNTFAHNKYGSGTGDYVLDTTCRRAALSASGEVVLKVYSSDGDTEYVYVPGVAMDIESGFIRGLSYGVCHINERGQWGPEVNNYPSVRPADAQVFIFHGTSGEGTVSLPEVLLKDGAEYTFVSLGRRITVEGLAVNGSTGLIVERGKSVRYICSKGNLFKLDF